MKSILKAGCGLVILFGLVIAALLFYGKSGGERAVGEFFAKAESQSAAEFRELIHPGLIKEADPELIQVFMQTVQKECGRFAGLNMNGMSFSDKYENGVRTEEYKGNFRFEKQELPMEMTFVDGKLLGFSVKDQAVAVKLVAALRVMPASLIRPYAEKAAAFWTSALTGNPEEAFGMLHENLQVQYGKERFLETFKEMTNQAGKLTKVIFVSSRPKTDEEGKVLFFFKLDFVNEKGVNAHSVIELAGFKGHLLGFSIPSSETP